jgi:DNA repair protein RecN (Recombination protein N)
MLVMLSIRNIVLIESLDIPFTSGLCVLTGETGAGKSILLDALTFALGGRGNSRLLRHGAAQGSVTAEFDIKETPHLQKILEEHGLEPGETLYLRRVLTADGKNKCFINDAPISVTLLATIGEMLVEIHGQHEQRGLLEPATHRAIIDAYGQLDRWLLDVGRNYSAWRAATDELARLCHLQAQAEREEDYLRHIGKELQSLQPEVGEEALLADKRTALMNKEKLADTLKSALGELTNKNPVEAALLSAQRTLTRNTAHAPAGSFDAAIDALERASIEVSEAVLCLENLTHALGDGDNLEQIEERLFALRAAGRKFGRPVDELPQYLEEITSKLSLLDGQTSQISKLSKDVEHTKAVFIAAANELSEQRAAAAQEVTGALLAELRPLKMDQIRFQVVIESLPEENWSAMGSDKVHFLVSANPGSPLGPLAKIASGGELSRFMLALKVVLSEVNSIPVMIFDEIDTGIGGAVADAVGKRLEALGQALQVLVVTHQPQVAARGNFHLKVRKQVQGNETTTLVNPLAAMERSEEIARMLSGAEITEEARAAADKLLVKM